MVLVLGVSAGASGARAILTHSDQPHLDPIDRCFVPRRSGTGVDESVVAAVARIRQASARRGEVISATAVACRTQAHADAIRAVVPRLGGRAQLQVVAEPTAQLRYLSFVEQLPDEGSVILYDLGSSGLTVTRADCASRTVLRTKRTTVLCGDGYDTLLQWRLARLGIVADADTVRRYRETLSIDRVVTAEDRKSGNRIVFTSSDFAELATAGIQHSVSFVNQLIDEAGVRPEGIALLGGCVRNRHLVELLGVTMGLPMYVEPEPEYISARGAVLLAVDRPARVVRVARAISAAAPIGEPTSRRKLVAALAVTAVLGATVTGLMVADRQPGPGGTSSTTSTPVEVAKVPARSFK